MPRRGVRERGLHGSVGGGCFPSTWKKSRSPRGGCRKVRRGGRCAARAPGPRRWRQERRQLRCRIASRGGTAPAGPGLEARCPGRRIHRAARASEPLRGGEQAGPRGAPGMGGFRPGSTPVDSRGPSDRLGIRENVIYFAVFRDIFPLPARCESVATDARMAGPECPSNRVQEPPSQVSVRFARGGCPARVRGRVRLFGRDRTLRGAPHRKADRAARRSATRWGPGRGTRFAWTRL